MRSDLHDAPAVSVIIGNHNSAQFLKPLFKSLCRQSITNIEIIFIDDASTDESVSVARAAAANDSRIRVEALNINRGPSAARNAGLGLARGKWIAIVDSDDLIHPCRLEQLIIKAEERKADIIADDLLVFYEDGSKPHRHLKGARSKAATEVSLEDYIRENRILSSTPPLGYLKPLFRRQTFEELGLRYDEALRIGEDYNLVLRALSAGLKFWIEPYPYYLYRKHASSVSHRLNSGDICKILSADEAFLQTHAPRGNGVRKAYEQRQASLKRAAAWNDLVDALKAKQLLPALYNVLKNPSILPFLAWPICTRIQAIWRHIFPSDRCLPGTAGNSVCIISRQRLAGPTRGNSNYVLRLAAALNSKGYQVHLIHPSPNFFGRLPLLLRRREAKVFRSIHIRLGLQIGPVMMAKDPRVLMGFISGLLLMASRKLGLKVEDRPAPYSIAAPWEPADYLFLARHARALSDVIVFDYAFQTDAAPYILRPDAKSFVLMHDLVSSRREQFARLGASDSVASISEQEELRLLTGADVIVAIQEEEASYVRDRTNGHKVLCAPIGLPISDKPHPGEEGSLLFVGSNTAPNVIGLKWFLSKVWPLIIARAPAAQLKIAGSVSRELFGVPRNVSLLGIVTDLKPLYETSALVISPLLAGSGLKIKLIEALCYGKAIVSTTPTLRGVSAIVKGAVTVADEAEQFAEAVLQCLENPDLRSRQAALALEVARTHFSSEQCYRSFLDAVNESDPQNGLIPEHNSYRNINLDMITPGVTAGKAVNLNRVSF